MTSARDRRLSIEASLRHEADTLAQIKGQMEQADRATLAMSSFRIHLTHLNTPLASINKHVNRNSAEQYTVLVWDAT